MSGMRWTILFVEKIRRGKDKEEKNLIELLLNAINMCKKLTPQILFTGTLVVVPLRPQL